MLTNNIRQKFCFCILYFKTRISL